MRDDPDALARLQASMIIRQSAYRWKRMLWRQEHPLQENTRWEPTPEQEAERNARIDRSWKL